jgi:WD40 repeat protein
MPRDQYVSPPIAFSPDERYLASAFGILILETGQVIDLEEHDISTYTQGNPAFSPDGQILAAESRGILRIWRVSDGSLLTQLDDPNATFRPKIVFSPNGTLLFGLGDGFVNIWGIRETIP